jgi:osmoprotectant transport system permease protein
MLGDGPLIDWDWIGSHTGLLLQLFWEHVQLTIIAVAIGLAVSFPLAIYAHQHVRPPLKALRVTPYTLITSITGVLYTIPSLALFAFLLPYTGLTTTTAEIGLVSYTLLILIRNIVAGLQGVPPDAREAALGMGYSKSQLLWRVELPLALPVIIAGIRVATVTVIGLVTVTSLIGKGGFGSLILEGFRLLDSTRMLLGAVLSMLLAIAFDGLLVGAERVSTPWTHVGAQGRG